MAALVEQKEAARLLGISEEEIKTLISRNEMFGYRDGPNWKFKMEELERVADERGITLGQASPAPGGSGIDSDLEALTPVDDLIEDDDAESILVSEEELGQSSVGSASTIIGKEDLPSDESDVQIAQDPSAGEQTSDVLMSTSSDDLLGDSAATTGSDLDIAGGSDVIAEGSGVASGSATGIGLGDEDFDIEMDEDASGVGSGVELEVTESLEIDDELGEGDSLALDDDADSLALDDDWDDESPTVLGGAAAVGGDDEEDDLLLSGTSGLLDDDDASALALGEDESIEIGSGAGSDVTLGAGDSGIGLANPTDSGLSLEEEPVELGGSQVGAMALGEDDMIELEEEGDPDAATQLKADDDFLLTPVDDDEDDESDSGSQVIALDTEQFDDTADTMLAAGPAVLEEDDFGEAPAPAGMAPAGAMMGQPMMHPAAQLPEAKYSIWNVLSLMLVFAMLAITGMLMVDVVQNMWQYDEPVSASGTLMEYVLEIVPK